MSSEAPPPDRIALVTGAGSGIGEATARALVAAGFVTVFAGRTGGTLDAARAGLDPERAVAIVADVTDPASVRALFDAVEARFGRLDLLFNNAGTTLPATDIEAIAYDDWRRVIDTSLTGAFLCTQQAFRLMKAQRPQGGRIVNNGSVAAQSPRPRSAAYTAAKSGMTGLTRAAALDGRSVGIACGQIDIGNAGTDMAAQQRTGAEQADGRVAVEPLLDTAYVAEAICRIALLPTDVAVPFMTIMPTRMPLIGRG